MTCEQCCGGRLGEGMPESPTSPSFSLAPVIRRPYRNLTEAIYWMHKEWPDWEVRRDEVAKCQALTVAEDAVWGVITHGHDLAQTIYRCREVELDRISKQITGA
jgi:hypothetical protein